MSSEAVALSVSGSLFHTCADDPHKVELAVQVMQILIDDFGVANMFGRKNLQYFADMTRTGIRVKEKFKYEYRYPRQGSVPCKYTLPSSDNTLHYTQIAFSHTLHIEHVILTSIKMIACLHYTPKPIQKR